MGFLDKLRRAFSEEDKPKVDVNSDDMIQFQNSISGILSLIENQLYKFTGLCPEGKKEIEEKIREIKDAMAEKKPDMEIKIKVEELRRLYKKNEQIAKQKLLIYEVERAINRINSLRKQSSNDYYDMDQLLKTIEGEEDYINSIGERKSEFDSQERDILIYTLIKARYSITMAKLEYANILIYEIPKYWDSLMSKITDIPEAEKIYWERFLIDDMQEMIERHNSLYTQIKGIKEKRELLGITSQYKSEKTEQEISGKIDKMIEAGQRDLMDDFQITGLFKSPDFLKMFIGTVIELNDLEKQIELDKKSIEAEKEKRERQLRQEEEIRKSEEEQKRIEKQREEERRAQQSRYKEITEEEIRKQLRKIDDSIFDMKEKYKRIMEFQTDVARAKGLLTSKETMENEGICLLPCRTVNIARIAEQARSKNIYYYILLGVDDDKDTSIIAVANQDREEVKIDQNELKGFHTSGEESKISDKMSSDILSMIPQENRGLFVIKANSRDSYSVYQYYDDKARECRKEMEKLYVRIHELNSSSSIEHIPFHIQVPFGRSMSSILQKLKQQGIEYYIPPVDIEGFDMKKCNPFYRIYIDRKYLGQYEEFIHPVISNLQDGAVLIGDKEVNLSDILLRNTKFPYSIGNKKEKNNS